MTRVTVKLALMSVLALSALGCVSQKAYDDLKLANHRAEDQIVDLRTQLEEANSRIRALQEAGKATDPNVLDKLAAALADRDRLSKALAEAEDRLRAAGMASTPLPMELNKALADLANSDPGLMQYDPKLGMIRFRSDLTFASGSAEVKAEAKASLDKLAGILRSPVAAQFEARIVGHTDNVPVHTPATVRLHPNNWYLSVHRAVAVEEVLQKAGVPPVRLSAAGYGQYHPAVPNGPHGAEGNRRVEIFLLTSTYTGMGVEDAAVDTRERPVTPKAPDKNTEPPEMLK